MNSFLVILATLLVIPAKAGIFVAFFVILA